MSDNLEFYNLIDSSKYQETLQFLISYNTEIVLKVLNVHSRAKILSKRNENEFLISNFTLETLKSAPIKNERITASFELNKNKYFFKTTLNSDQKEVTITIPKEIFMLQRRNDFRIPVPMTTKVDADIISINGKRHKEKFEIRDISLGGCKIVVKKTDQLFKVNDEIQIQIKMLDLESEPITCSIRHLLDIPDLKSTQLGLSFVDPDADLLTDLQSLMIHLDRILRGKSYD